MTFYKNMGQCLLMRKLIPNHGCMEMIIAECTGKGKEMRVLCWASLVFCMHSALFAWTYQPNQPAIQQYFSLTTNQRTVLSAMAYQLSEQGVNQTFLNYIWTIKRLPVWSLLAMLLARPLRQYIVENTSKDEHAFQSWMVKPLCSHFQPNLRY
jgi:hypothetical protein